MRINPILAFYFISGLLIAGAFSQWPSGSDFPIEIIWISLFSALLFIGNLVMQFGPWQQVRFPKVGMNVETDIFCATVLTLVGCLFVIRGIPLLSANPNVARVEFFAEGAVLAKSFALVPAIIAMAAVMFGNPDGRRALIYGAIACLETIMAGNKQAPFTIGLPIIAGFWCTGRRIPLKLLISGGILATILVLFLFTQVTNESEASQNAWDLLWLRVSETNEAGLRICVENAEALGVEPTVIAFQSVLDRLNGNVSGYPISTGRYITTFLFPAMAISTMRFGSILSLVFATAIFSLGFMVLQCFVS